MMWNKRLRRVSGAFYSDWISGVQKQALTKGGGGVLACIQVISTTLNYNYMQVLK